MQNSPALREMGFCIWPLYHRLRRSCAPSRNPHIPRCPAAPLPPPPTVPPSRSAPRANPRSSICGCSVPAAPFVRAPCERLSRYKIIRIRTRRGRASCMINSRIPQVNWSIRAEIEPRPALYGLVTFAHRKKFDVVTHVGVYFLFLRSLCTRICVGDGISRHLFRDERARARERAAVVLRV